MSEEFSLPEEGRTRRRVGLALGLCALAAIALVPSGLHDVPGYGSRPALAAGVAALMAIWWLTEALPIAWTACAPLVLFPLLGVHGRGVLGGLGAAAEPYVDAYIFMFLGGMAIGAGMEQRKLHKRIALGIMLAIGTEPRRLLAGVIVATATLSLWISNTATAVMMVPIGVALLRQLEEALGRPVRELGTALMLAIAYAANVGGIGTKVGSGTNSIFCGFVEDKLGLEMGFLRYALLGLPFVVLMLPVVYGVLWRHAKADGAERGPGEGLLRAELAALGRLRGHELAVALVFAATAILWTLGDPIRRELAPWVLEASGFKMQSKHWEAAVALAAAAVLLVGRSLSLRSFARMPFGTLLLLGGSFSLAAGIEAGGFGATMTRALAPVATMSLGAQVAIASFATVFLTAIASNTAAVNVALNVLPPDLRVLSSTVLAASCDFALPAGTPPNAIVFASGYIRLPTMMRIGVLLDVLAATLIVAYVLLYASRLY